MASEQAKRAAKKCLEYFCGDWSRDTPRLEEIIDGEYSELRAENERLRGCECGAGQPSRHHPNCEVFQKWKQGGRADGD